MAGRPSDQLKKQFKWLADAPLFMDSDQISRIHDAVVQPELREGTTTIEVSKEVAGEMGAKIGLTGEVEPNDLLKTISSLLPFLKFKAKAEAAGEGKVSRKGGETEIVEFHPITSPERQLIHLAIHYLAQLPDRIQFVDDLSAKEWRYPAFIGKSPRALVFLDIPSGVKIIPTAAEFANGVVELMYQEFENPIRDELKDRFMEYPAEPTRELLKSYWLQFKDRFSATKAMVSVEKASERHKGGIRWIDYRVLLNDEGDSLHLHVNAAGKYDTGVFAYNFVKRSYKHGVRIVGTLKSEPDLNVLAIYDK